MRWLIARWRYLVLGLCLALVLGWGGVAWQIASFAEEESSASADAAIVLGAAAWGNRPSPVYRERINEAISLYKQQRVRWIIFTGGSKVAGFPSEAQVGREFAASKGVPLTAMLSDTESRSTWQNLEQAKLLMSQNKLKTALLVSDPLHLRRAASMAADLGLQTQPAPTQSSRYQSWQQRSRFLWRETWIYLDYLFFGHRSEEPTA